VTFRSCPSVIPLREVWDIDDGELSPNGSDVWTRLESSAEPLKTIYRDVCWQGQALLEFQDLQDMPLPNRGRWMTNLAYLFFESLSALRQVVICGFNGQVHAALAALRSSLEVMVYHYWWRRKQFDADDYEPFYDWLLGKEPHRNFARVLTDTLNDLQHPPQAFVFNELKTVYSQLCSYAHKALLDEAIITVRGGNAPQSSDGELSTGFRSCKELSDVWLTLRF
jgi:hypothetical protein